MAANSRPTMRSTVWVGRVKSTCPPELLETAFSKAGRVLRVETGFAGFAFIEYDREEDADRACEIMNKANIPNVGEVRVSRATHRGYEDACNKRGSYWRARGHKGDAGWCFTSRGHRSLSVARRRAPHDSRSRPRPAASGSRGRSGSASERSLRSRSQSCRRRPSPSRSRSPLPQKTSPEQRRPAGSRSPSASQRRSRVPSRRQHARNPRAGGGQSPRRSRSASRRQEPPAAQGRTVRLRSPSAAPERSASAPAREVRGSAPAAPAADAQAVVPASEQPLAAASDQIQLVHDLGQLTRKGRAEAVRFFDGASARGLLLEGGAVARVPDYLVPLFLNGFPYGFQGLSQEGAMELLEVLTAFTTSATGEASDLSGAERTAEVRQTLVVGAKGGRTLRKALVINGVELCSEERAL